MEDDNIKRLWNAGRHQRDELQTFSSEEIAHFLARRSSKNSRGFYLFTYTHLLVQLVALMLLGANIPGYSANSTRVTVLALLMGLCFMCMVYGLSVLSASSTYWQISESRGVCVLFVPRVPHILHFKATRDR